MASGFKNEVDFISNTQRCLRMVNYCFQLKSISAFQVFFVSFLSYFIYLKIVPMPAWLPQTQYALIGRIY